MRNKRSIVDKCLYAFTNKVFRSFVDIVSKLVFKKVLLKSISGMKIESLKLERFYFKNFKCGDSGGDEEGDAVVLVIFHCRALVGIGRKFRDIGWLIFPL